MILMTRDRFLTAVSPFYGFYAKTLTLEPDFTGTALDGEIHFKRSDRTVVSAVDGGATVYQ